MTKSKNIDRFYYGILKGIGSLLEEGKEDPWTFSQLWEASGLSVRQATFGIVEALEKGMLFYGENEDTYYLGVD